MNVFIPYPSPIDVAKCLDKMRLRPQINMGGLFGNPVGIKEWLENYFEIKL